MTYFTEWDAPSGIFKAGSIKRASSSNDKVWGEVNKSDEDLLAGTFVKVNPAGGILPLAATTDRVHGIIVRGVFGDKIPKSETADVGHFSHGDEVVALAVTGQAFARGDKVNIVASGANKGKITKVVAGTIATDYYATEVSGDLVAITLGFAQTVGA